MHRFVVRVKDCLKDSWCFLSGHDFGQWADGLGGYFWRQCHKCGQAEHKPYVDVVLDNRARRARARGKAPQ